MFSKIMFICLIAIEVHAVKLPPYDVMKKKIEELEKSLVEGYMTPTPEEMFERNMKHFIYYYFFLNLAEHEVEYETIVNPIVEHLDNSLPRVGCWCCYSSLYRRVNMDSEGYIENLFNILFSNESYKGEKDEALAYWHGQYNRVTSKFHLGNCSIM